MTHRSHFVDINFANEKQGQDELLCANTRPPSPLRPDPTDSDLSAVREDVPRHAFTEKSFVWMSSLAIVEVVKTSKHAAINSVRPHDFRCNMLIMLTSLRQAIIIAKTGKKFWVKYRSYFSLSNASADRRAKRVRSSGQLDMPVSTLSRDASIDSRYLIGRAGSECSASTSTMMKGIRLSAACMTR